MKGCGITDTGKVRSVNQDSFLGKELPGNAYLAVVCDGMGGAAGGGIASSIAKDIFCSDFEKTFREVIENDFEDGTPQIVIPRLFTRAVNACNLFTYNLSLGDPELRGMGTTLVALLSYKDLLCVCNVGDSRCYVFGKDSARQVTKDHSVVQKMIDDKLMTENEAKTSNIKNIITRAVGVSDSVEADVFVVRMTEEIRYAVLCSDGLSNYLSDDDFLKILMQPDDVLSLEKKTKCLVDLANKRGGNDNITAFLLDFHDKGNEV